jgi:hypothetical protein
MKMVMEHCKMVQVQMVQCTAVVVQVQVVLCIVAVVQVQVVHCIVVVQQQLYQLQPGSGPAVKTDGNFCI